ncbi:hypothetical protein SAMN05444397_11616 [Flavobacterium aquidurense]|uniref:Helicase HerA central domain-containing protein n=1 Tax=Flavobacterium frigidimaris TaxID=262320 RepID=A0ABX4BL83_FLAFR|nr:DUF87 domain-containing protein [Flavobacterium frigidimaris]OXA76710.1 hypothetical protein B0A65_18115 [Flavobacterium frigidimaris]SDZ66187.1 hypothetical protein SAMN05444397_11616 [Flavobacterium aquidurense]
MSSDNRLIGRVLSVDNFRVFIKIEDDLRGTYKSGVLDIYEVARINSYLIIPVGADRVVALITRVTMKEEVEFGKNSTSISLPTSSRYISATMLGTIANNDSNEKFVQGVYNFPTLDNPVWYVTEKDLLHIFDDKLDVAQIKWDKDFYLPVGTSPAFSNYKVKISPDQFFVKHAAILGNTGSGKSCTLTSILRNLFRYDYKGSNLNNAHFVIFDTNGEYKDAFLPEQEVLTTLDDKTQKELELINANYYGGEDKVQVPYWLMNWSDFRALLNPSDATQAPLLNSAIGLAKNNEESLNISILPIYLKADVESILSCSTEELKKRTWDAGGNWRWKANNEILNIAEAIRPFDDELATLLSHLGGEVNFNNAGLQTPIRESIYNRLNKLLTLAVDIQITSSHNIDLPIYFNYQQLCNKFLDAAIKNEGSGNTRLNEFISTLRLRMNSFLNDKRMAIPLMLKNTEEINKNVLPQFLAFLLGDYNKVFSSETENHFVKKYNDSTGFFDLKRTHQINIIDVSQLPFEVLETITALLGRIILEFVSYFVPSDRGKFPIVIILEEAQNYIAENKYSVAKTIFERIAREGRKYGISLIVSSQRPSELSKTVLSQCNSFIIHRLQNPEDQKYIRGLVSSANADILEQLPVIPQQHAIITGDCVRAPIQVRIDDVHPTPNSHNPKYIESWLASSTIPYEATVNKWIGNSQSAE